MLRQRPTEAQDESSHLRKKPRMSSEFELTQSKPPSQPMSHPAGLSSQRALKNPDAKARRDRAIQHALKEAERERNKALGVPVASAATSTRQVQTSSDIDVEIDLAEGDSSDDSPVAVPEPDLNSWFSQSATETPATASFTPASQLPEVADKVSGKPVPWTAPSEEVVILLSQRISKWQEEDPDEPNPTNQMANDAPLPRPALTTLDNQAPRILSQQLKSATFKSPLLHPPATPRQNPLVPPATRNRVGSMGGASSSDHAYQGSPLNPNHRPNPSQFATPSRAAPLFSTPARGPGLGMTPRARLVSTSRPAFTTPFKAGMGQGEKGRLEAEKAKQELKAKEAAERERKAKEQREKERLSGVFDLTLPPTRYNMEGFGITPGSYTVFDLATLGIPPEIPSVNLSNAPYYRFNAPSSSQVTSPAADQFLGINAAMQFLRRNGCSLVTKEWAENHWSLILWKVAGLVCADPGLLEDKWKFEEIANQLLYRYEREYNRAQRPAVRLIQERDSPSTRPMVLVISAITWNEPEEELGNSDVQEAAVKKPEKVPPHPELEVTDGWYRVRATVDGALARAVRRKVLKVGSKIAITGARLDGSKEPAEPLQAYHRSHLVLTGNSTCLARWTTKLGFQPRPFVATLRSLSPDGGLVTLLDLMIVRCFPVGYIEMPSGSAGARPLPPRSEKDEREEEEKWKTRLANEEIRLRDTFEKKVSFLEEVAERYGRAAGHFVISEDSYPSDKVEDILDELECNDDPNSFLKTLPSSSQEDSAWLTKRVKERCTELRERAGEEIQKELNETCPPRQVRNFRVVVVKDYTTEKHPSLRTAQLTVWDVLSIGDGEDGGVAEGKRYMVSNVTPSQVSAWQHHDTEGAEIFLNTRKDSRWTRLPVLNRTSTGF